MKNWLILATLLMLTGACHSDKALEPSDYLYQRWRVLQYKKVQDTTWISSTNTTSDIEFRLDGTLIYRTNGNVTETPCCASSRFERDKMTIRFIDQNGCPYALCLAMRTNVSAIVNLSRTSLELTIDDRITQYVSVN